MKSRSIAACGCCGGSPSSSARRIFSRPKEKVFPSRLSSTERSLPSFPDIRKWNAEAVLTVPLVAYGDGERAKERLARQYRAVLSKAAEAGYRTLSIAPLSDYPLDLEGEIAASSVNAFFAFNPSSPMSVTFVLPDESSLARFLSSDHEEEG